MVRDTELPDRPALKEHGFRLVSLAGESKLSPKSDIVGEPKIDLVKEIIKVARSYKTGPNYFVPIKADRLD